jgi:hypothetical protein
VHFVGSYYTDLFWKLGGIYKKRVCQRVSSQRRPAEERIAHRKSPFWYRIYYTGAPNLFSFNNDAWDTKKKHSPQTHEQERQICTTNKQTHTWLTAYHTLLYYIAPTCFNANASSSGSSHSVPAKLHKRVHAVLVYTPGRRSDIISTQTVCTATWEIS